MQTKRIDQGLAVGGQIAPGDMETLADAGFRTVIDNRPDGEEEGQPSADELARAAEANGLTFHHIPITPGEFGEDSVARMRDLRLSAEEPIFAFCRTGARSVTLDALANPHGRSADDRIAVAKAAGYDIADKRPLLGRS